MPKKYLLLCIAFLLSSCSLVERSPEDMNDQNSLAESTEDPTKSADYLERELSRLSAKIEALETKVDVLTTNMERQQLKGTQPSVGVDVNPSETNSIISSQVTSTSMSATSNNLINLSPTNAGEELENLNRQERDFKTAMELFQNGKNLEAGVAFTNFAKRNPIHHLASHALYWSGESNARAEQWRLAVSSWEDLRSQYPRSAYLPEALAGLARVYSAMGDTGKAQAARSSLLRNFPQAPATLSLQTSPPAMNREETTRQSIPSEEEIPQVGEADPENGELE